MTTFDIIKREQGLLDWLYANVGYGGRWLRKDGQVEPDDGDAWGYWFDASSCRYKLGILDEKKAVMYALRWS